MPAVNLFRERLVSHPPTISSPLRTLCQMVLAIAALVAAGRIVQLAFDKRASIPTTAESTPIRSTALGSAGGSQFPSKADSELAELYKACPLAAVIDLQTVATHPERIDAILPPYRETADHVPDTPLEPAIPRIRYPVALDPALASIDAGLHPADAHTGKVPRMAAKSGDKEGEWLVDPKEWFGSDQKTSVDAENASDTKPNPPADSSHDVGDVSDANSTPQSNAPSALEKPPTETTPEVPTKSESAAPKQPLFPPPASANEPTATEQLPAPSNTPGNPVSTPASSIFPAPPATAASPPPAVDPHLALFTKNAYPSAPSAPPATKTFTTSGACRPTRMPPFRRCSINSSSGSMIFRRVPSGTSAYAATRRLLQPLRLAGYAALEPAGSRPRRHHLRRLSPRAIRVREIQRRAPH